MKLPPSLASASLLPLLLLSSTPAHANTEKAIFLGPAPAAPDAHPPIDDSVTAPLDALTLDAAAGPAQLRARLPASFPSTSKTGKPADALGRPTWLVLAGLEEGRRYEVRVCWAATQPTAFTLRTHAPSAVASDPDLLRELTDYSLQRQVAVASPQDVFGRWGDFFGDDEDIFGDVQGGSRPAPPPVQHVNIKSNKPIAKKGSEDDDAPSPSSSSTTLLLQIYAAADYFTTDTALMHHVPPVHVDIILDPFLFNVLPRSLLPTVLYIVIVAVASLLIGRRVAASLHAVARQPSPPAGEKKKL